MGIQNKLFVLASSYKILVVQLPFLIVFSALKNETENDFFMITGEIFLPDILNKPELPCLYLQFTHDRHLVKMRNILSNEHITELDSIFSIDYGYLLFIN